MLINHFMLIKSFFFSLLICLLLISSANAIEPLRHSDSVEKLVRQTKDKKQQIEILLAAAKKFKPIAPDDALAFSSRALIIASSADYSEFKLQAMLNIGMIQAIKTQLVSGMEMALKAKELAIRLDNKKALGEAYLIIGLVRIFQGNYSESYESHFTALKLFEQINDQEGIVNTMNGIGNICYYQGNYTKADIYYSNALKLARELHDTIQIANVLNNVGLVLVERGQTEKAIGCYQEAIGINRSLGLKMRLATNYLNLGWACYKQNHFNDFILNCNQAIEIYSSIGSRYSLAICYLSFSDYYKLMNDPKNLYKYTWMAYSEGIQYNLREVVFQATVILQEFYYSTGKIDSAYKYSLIGHAAKDSINSEQSTARLALLEMEYDYDKRQKEDKLYQQRKDFLIIIMIILAISGLITTILFLSRQIVKTKNIRLEKQRLSDVVEFKDKELTLNVMNLIKKNEIIVDISNRLIQMEQNTTDPAMKQEIIQLINSLQRSSSHEIWEEFEVRFKQVHNSFYEKLLGRFPELTPSELKLCALLRLNLSTKEICELSGQRPSTLDVARYRLRKKLGLSNSQVNLVTFLSQV